MTYSQQMKVLRNGRVETGDGCRLTLLTLQTIAKVTDRRFRMMKSKLKSLVSVGADEDIKDIMSNTSLSPNFASGFMP